MRCWRCGTRALAATWDGVRCLACGADGDGPPPPVPVEVVEEAEAPKPRQRRQRRRPWWWEAREHDGYTCPCLDCVAIKRGLKPVQAPPPPPPVRQVGVVARDEWRQARDYDLMWDEVLDTILAAPDSYEEAEE